MAIVALALWTLTVAAGVYLLVTSTRVKSGTGRDGVPEPGPEPEEALEAASPGPAAAVASGASQGQASAPVLAASAEAPAAPPPGMVAGAAPASAVKPVKKRDRFDPQSLRDAKSEPIPGIRALGEFTHPALAIIGFAFWLLYTMVHDRLFAAIALGVILGAIAAGVSWAVSNGRAAKKREADALVFSGRALAFHIAGAALTLLLAALITAHV